MPKKLQLQKKRFGKLLVVSENGRDCHGATMWRCKCDCGNTTLVRGASLVATTTKSCGCGIRESNISIHTTHGASKSELYLRWQAMKRRCYAKNNSEYKNYGGRGIRVCRRWKNSFSNFMADMAAKFNPRLELDRRNNNGDYEPKNCRWISKGAQQRNKRNNHTIKINGSTKTLAEWGETSGLKPNTILTRIRRGWPKRRLLEIANS